MELIETMFEPADEVLQLEQFSGCTAAETEATIEKFEFESSAVVFHTKWRNYGRESGVTITAFKADGSNALWFKEMSRFRQWKKEVRVKLSKKWGMEAEYATSLREENTC
jgi:hypothetical protein